MSFQESDRYIVRPAGKADCKGRLLQQSSGGLADCKKVLDLLTDLRQITPGNELTAGEKTLSRAALLLAGPRGGQTNVSSKIAQQHRRWPTGRPIFKIHYICMLK